jgi:hypothetical protein
MDRCASAFGVTGVPFNVIDATASPGLNRPRSFSRP